MKLLRFFSVAVGPIVALVLLNGCAHTVFFGRPLDTTTFALAAGADRPIHLSTCPVEDRLALGHQYLFVVLPFGSLTLGNPGTYLQRRAYAGMSLAGLRPLTDKRQANDGPQLEVCIKDVSVTAYDLIFVRRATASVELTLTLVNNGISTTVTTAASNKMYVKFAFKDRLESMLDKAVDAAFEKGLRELSLYAPAQSSSDTLKKP